MFKTVSLIFSFLIFFNPLRSQILPREGSLLNYRLIGFSFPANGKANKFNLEIAKGNFDSENVFKENILKAVPCKKNRVIAEVPAFAQEYTWRVVYTDSKGSLTKGDLHHFATGGTMQVDTNYTRLRVLDGSKKYKDVYFFSDYNKVLYDMNGNALWYMPEKTSMTDIPRDIKLSPRGTVTFLIKDQAYEVNYNGDILWKGPNDGRVSGDSQEHYHHEFTRLANGHYMVLGDEGIARKQSNFAAGDLHSGGPGVNSSVDSSHPATPFGTIIEYDETGKVVWSWRSSSYFFDKGGDIVNFLQRPGELVAVHENAFYFDEQHKVIYVGFKNISRILKVKYPEGTVMNAWGEIFSPGVPEKGNDLFCHQHSIGKTKKGLLYVFNNNSCNPGSPAKIVMMREPAAKNGTLQKIWEFSCPIEKGAPGIYTTGGNVTEMSDNSLFVCMGVSLSRLFVVDMNKKLLWSAYTEVRNPDEKKWTTIGQYRAGIFEGRARLEQLIWNTEAK